MEKLKFNKKIFAAWCLYDWAGSSFSLIVTTFIFAPYFISDIAKNEIIGTHQWANAISLSGLIIAIVSPLMGAISDHTGRHKVWLFYLTVLPIVAAGLLWFAYPNVDYVNYTLVCVVVGTISSEIAYVFYNSFLPKITPVAYLGRASGWAWGISSIGGVIVLCVALVFFVQAEPQWLDINTAGPIRITGPLVAIWLFLFSIPFFMVVPDTRSTIHSFSQAILLGFHELKNTYRLMRYTDKNILIYLIAQLFFTDGLNTLVAFGGVYAAGTFHMELSNIILLGILMNCFAGLGAIMLAWLDDLLGSKFTIMLSLAFMILLGIPLLIIKSQLWFWILSLSISLFLGPIQASARALLVRLSPPEQITQYFGLYALTGRITAFLGPWILGIATLYFNSQRAGMATIQVFFVIGAIILYFVHEKKGEIISEFVS